MTKTLLERCRESLISEPIVFQIDDDGTYHFATESQPFRTSIVVSELGFHPWIKVDELRKRVTILLDGKTVVYTRIGYGLHGEWICDRCAATL